MIPTNEIIQGDVLEFLRELPAECADLVIADPPYNLNKDFGIGVRHSDVETWLHWSAQWLAELKRILSPSGNLFVYSIHHFACFLQCRLYEMDLIYRRQIIWHYENGWSMYKNGPACHYEPLLWFAKRADSTFHVIREPYKSQARLKHKITKNGDSRRLLDADSQTNGRRIQHRSPLTFAGAWCDTSRMRVTLFWCRS